MLNNKIDNSTRLVFSYYIVIVTYRTKISFNKEYNKNKREVHQTFHDDIYGLNYNLFGCN